MDSIPPYRMNPSEIYCPECGYDLRGIPEGMCPECGFRYDRQAIRSFNRHWALNRLVELQYSVGLQAVGLVALAVLAAFTHIPYPLYVLLVVITVRLVMKGVAWTFDTEKPGGVVDGLVDAARSLGFWLTVLLGILILLVIIDQQNSIPRCLVPLPGLVFGLIAWTRFRAAEGLHRDSKLVPALARQVRRWHWANIAMVGLSGLTSLALLNPR